MSEQVEDDGAKGLTPDEAESIQTVVAFHREHYHSTSSPQRAIDRLTNSLSQPATLLLLVATFVVWAMISARNASDGLEASSFGWLELIATLGALLMSMLILVTQRREDELAERRAQLTLELALLADRKNAKIISLLEALRRDAPGVVDHEDAESEAMATPADADAMIAAIDSAADDHH